MRNQIRLCLSNIFVVVSNTRRRLFHDTKKWVNVNLISREICHSLRFHHSANVSMHIPYVLYYMHIWCANGRIRCHARYQIYFIIISRTSATKTIHTRKSLQQWQQHIRAASQFNSMYLFIYFRSEWPPIFLILNTISSYFGNCNKNLLVFHWYSSIYLLARISAFGI